MGGAHVRVLVPRGVGVGLQASQVRVDEAAVLQQRRAEAEALVELAAPQLLVDVE